MVHKHYLSIILILKVSKKNHDTLNFNYEIIIQKKKSTFFLVEWDKKKYYVFFIELGQHKKFVVHDSTWVWFGKVHN